eukprot:TRINITY_DN21856_c0_g1_i2.p1 TRINITY_DN21856_c0_g1~~TRINITY_DN21856_c0_g1_i2.p1  ORF type:complete len:1127 (+),score=268.55 TRINITY_DN21856_c0_g1_i2:154-3534(+)
MASFVAIHSSPAWKTTISLVNGNGSAVPPASKHHFFTLSVFSEKYNFSRRHSMKVCADAGSRRRSRKKAVEPRSKNPIPKTKLAGQKKSPDVQTEINEKDESSLHKDKKEMTQKGWSAQSSVLLDEKQSLQTNDENKTSKAIKSKLIDKKSGNIAAESQREKFQELQLMEKIKDSDSAREETANDDFLNGMVLEEHDEESSPQRWCLQKEKDIQIQEIQNLAKENALDNKMFFYPTVAKPATEIQIFLNKSKTALANEPKVFIMGAFNDWRWNSFTLELNKSELDGDWWSCKLSIPKEAYKLDFVFFNGSETYENNNQKDFSVLVDDGMDKIAFEDFLLEEKRRELEKIAAEQAKREREAAIKRMEEEERAGKEQDKEEAKKQVAQKKMQTHQIFQKAVKSIDGLWYIEPTEFQGGDKVKLYYNRSSRPLALSLEVWIHGGYNNWVNSVTIIQKLSYSNAKDGDWWVTDVVVPDRAFMLNWVFANGPPGNANVYDNNNYQDFHAVVPKAISEDLYWVEEEHKIFLKLQNERRQRKEAAQKKAEKMAHMKAERKERTLQMFLNSQKHIFYTEPSKVQAGSNVNVLYNPSNTILNGKPEVWIRCSFNRWTHRLGILAPQKMVPVENSSHVKATIRVPLDAYMMDFVFSESGDEHGGCYDNRNGMDYHVPVVGGIVKEPPMHIAHIAVEMAPIAKVGGLGDVVTSLSRAVQELGHNVEIIVPKYDCLDYSHIHNLEVKMEYSWGGAQIKAWHGSVEGLPVYFIEPNNGMFWAGCIYGRKDDGNRFGFFCHASLEFLHQSGMHPDIIHCHDWSSAPVAWLFQESYKHYGLSNARVVFTIHNLEFGTGLIGKAMANAHKATTVSYTYAKEISSNPAIAPHTYKLHGIVNGIDPDIWDPFSDPFIPVAYTHENVVEGKKAAKEELQRRLGLKLTDRPLVGVITRLTAQKGIHLIKHAIWRTLDRSGQVVLLGSAPDPRIQNDFNNLANVLHNTKGDMARLCLTYNEPLSHLIYAGSDFILVPSIFEPCGLTQLTAMRYGTIPVVRKTGGLNDTVFDVDHDRGRAEAQDLAPNGFCFDVPDSAGIDYALNRAISAWYDNREWFHSLCKQVMEQDWSWNRPALDYMELYYCARK